MSGQWISIAAADGNASRAYLAIPEAGHGPGLVLLDETIAHEIADLYAAEGYVVLCPEQLDSDISATIAALRTRPECTGKVGVLGFGRGGGIAFLAAAEGGVDGAVIYYGAGITKALDPAPRIACPVVMHFAEKDPDVPPDAVARIKDGVPRSPQCRGPCLSRHDARVRPQRRTGLGPRRRGHCAFTLDRAVAQGDGPALRP